MNKQFKSIVVTTLLLISPLSLMAQKPAMWLISDGGLTVLSHYFDKKNALDYNL